MKNEAQYKAGYAAGVKLACAELGITEGDLVRNASKADILLRDPIMQNAICKVAATILAAGGEAMSEEHRLFCKMANYTDPFSDYTVDTFLVPVLRVLCKSASEKHEDALEKSAATLGAGLLARLFGKTISTGPEAMKLMSMLGVAGGAATGGLAWALNRDATQNEAEVEAKEQQAAHYRRLAKDIQKQMNLKEKKVSKKDKARKAAEEVGDANYVI